MYMYLSMYKYIKLIIDLVNIYNYYQKWKFNKIENINKVYKLYFVCLSLFFYYLIWLWSIIQKQRIILFQLIFVLKRRYLKICFN